MEKHHLDRLCCGEVYASRFIGTPLGRLLAASCDGSISLLEFSDSRGNADVHQFADNTYVNPSISVSSPVLEKLEIELGDYFNGKLKEFTVPVDLKGTPFQYLVWRELQRIPYGMTISYQELAQHIGQPGAVRAVAGACRMNPVSILVPCHRVIGKNGGLTGYSGGLWRKKLLLEMERGSNLSRR